MSITKWFLYGHRPARIPELVARAAREERKKREEALKSGTDVPPYVWDADPLPSERTLKRYMARVREEFEREGRELPKRVAEVAALTWARSNDLYQKALVDKKYTTCRMILRDQMEMFGLIGAIKGQLVPLGDAAPVPDVDTTHLPESQWTEEQLNRGMAELLNIGLLRIRGQRQQTSLPAVAEALGNNSEDHR